MSYEAPRRRSRDILVTRAVLGPVAVVLVGVVAAATVLPDAVVTPVVAKLSGVVAGDDLVRALRPDSIDDVVATAVTAVGAVVLAWYGLSSATFLVCAAATAVGRRWRAGEALLERWGAPVLRRGAMGVIALLVSTSMSATSAVGSPAPEPALPDDLRWSPTHGRLQEFPPAAAPPGGPGRAGDPAEGPAPPAGDVLDRHASREVHLVRPGESLWSIASASLRQRGVDPADPVVAAEWPRWYSANADTVGSDPHLIHPGQELLAP